MYDREKDLNWKTFKDISYMAAMGKVGSCDSDSVWCVSGCETEWHVHKKCGCGCRCVIERVSMGVSEVIPSPSVFPTHLPLAAWWRPQPSGSAVH